MAESRLSGLDRSAGTSMRGCDSRRGNVSIGSIVRCYFVARRAATASYAFSSMDDRAPASSLGLPGHTRTRLGLVVTALAAVHFRDTVHGLSDMHMIRA
jgi:hypothetical protein